jgi:hypothetical protein
LELKPSKTLRSDIYRDFLLDALWSVQVSNCLVQRSGGQYGENLYVSSNSNFPDMATVVGAWYDEVNHYDIGANNDAVPKSDEGVGPFTQVGHQSVVGRTTKQM